MAKTNAIEMYSDKSPLAPDASVREWLAQQRKHAQRTGNKVRAEAIHRRCQRWESTLPYS